MRRVVVTGLGMIAPTGNNVADSWDSVLESRSAVRPYEDPSLPGFEVRVAAGIRDFDPKAVIPPLLNQRLGRFEQFALAAAHEAIADAGLDLSGDTDRYGCSVGSGMGSIQDFYDTCVAFSQVGARGISPYFLTRTLANMAAGEIAALHGLRGPNLCSTTACASGGHALGEAFFHIACGTADVMVAGGAEASVNPYTIGAFARMRALSRNADPATASRPFDRARDGFVVGEGAGILVLESHEHAMRRGARIYAEFAGYGTSCDAHHPAAPDPSGDGARRCMAAALASGGIALDEVSYINAHGTSTKLNDAAESRAIAALFGALAPKVPVSSTKGVTGHCLGAAGALEAIFSVLALHRQVIPSTAGHTAADPDCAPLDYVSGAPREVPLRVVLSNSFAFGGTNTCLAFRAI